MPFREFGLSPETLAVIRERAFVKPTPIQQKALPHLMAGRDVMGQAETGTGKTLAFILPIVEKVDPGRVSVQALIVTPTRELAHQIKKEFDRFAAAKRLRVALVIGGENMGEQILCLRGGSQIVVGTPGRILDHLESRTLTLGWVERLVLDEADELLDMGFIDAIREILKKCPPERQTMLFSATFPSEVERLAHSCMSRPIKVSTIEGLTTVPEIHQQYIAVPTDRKLDKLCEILDGDNLNVYLVFCQTKREVDVVSRRLLGRGYPIAALHGDFSQEHRNKVMERFRSRRLRALIATDVASRGLDIDVVSHVINYSIPRDARRYVHRIGRTGRAGRSGVAITFVSPEDRWKLKSIQRIGSGQASAGRLVQENEGYPGGRGERGPRSHGRLDGREEMPGGRGDHERERRHRGGGRRGHEAEHGHGPSEARRTEGEHGRHPGEARQHDPGQGSQGQRGGSGHREHR
ncbi:MAG: DEAD/DEAH box helicase [Planctomycetes bacterium]|nr:DEAD/DEAH box helicase [Planctomycetota bacterium]